MTYKFLLIFTLSFSLLTATDFKDINPAPNKTMLENQSHAKDCTSPAPANEDISESFKYGCFCGEDYPKMDANESKDFRRLRKKERIKVIESYFLVKPYDDIDAVCMQHDICYLYRGKKARTCNRAIYSELRDLRHQFKTENEPKKDEQCSHLATDIASVFQTIFASSDDKTGFFEFGSLLFNTTLTIAEKTLEESIDTIIDQGKRYPKKDEKCIVSKI
ncbi:MAG: Unknown protein [uncultured Sulfurovum sp.]|uniref:Uncharacterized protein n=1 Tax=uncultured Sulfurovum sp. TaxID=269237 RepID=A0A6S6STK2_9BACT|nr:MAG: Unknown protein [uncultured Sulfurovum sp.]